ncbi:MAG: GFA family protein [Alphaproteobacteria bacterium]|nr:GFA family protein [Alphaproteobacteria bacterium]
MEREGGCACGATRYKLTADPMIVHCCHCRDCQRLTGSAFVVNLWIERHLVEADPAGLTSAAVPGGSGKPHEIFRCAACGTAMWSKYHRAPGDTVMLRAGTLDQPDSVQPDVHIFTRSKLSWVTLPAGARMFDAYYRMAEVWRPERLDRWRRNLAGER